MDEDDDLVLLRQILSPVPAHGLVRELPVQPVTQHGLAELFSRPQRGREFVKILSMGRVGYLPKANLEAARSIDKDLKVLDGGVQSRSR